MFRKKSRCDLHYAACGGALRAGATCQNPPHEWERCPAALWGTTCHFSTLLITCYLLQDLPGSFCTSSDTQLSKKRHAWQGGLSRVSLRRRLILISRFLNFWTLGHNCRVLYMCICLTWGFLNRAYFSMRSVNIRRFWLSLVQFSRFSTRFSWSSKIRSAYSQSPDRSIKIIASPPLTLSKILSWSKR